MVPVQTLRTSPEILSTRESWDRTSNLGDFKNDPGRFGKMSQRFSKFYRAIFWQIYNHFPDLSSTKNLFGSGFSVSGSEISPKG